MSPIRQRMSGTFRFETLSADGGLNSERSESHNLREFPFQMTVLDARQCMFLVVHKKELEYSTDVTLRIEAKTRK